MLQQVLVVLLWGYRDGVEIFLRRTEHSRGVLRQKEDHRWGDHQEEVRPEGQQLVLHFQRVERAEAEAGLVQQRWKFQQAVEKSPMLKVLSEKW